MRNRRVVVTRVGGPETIEVRDGEVPEPGPGEVAIRVLASGVAYGDVLKRRGIIPGIRPPFTPGYDLVGEVERLGPGAARWRVGERVAAFVPNGANAERIALPERVLVAVPAAVETAEALALVLNYVTAWQMLHRVAAVKRGQRILVHGAAGGVGTALLELARLAGVVAYGTASAPKHELVTRLGGIPIDYRSEDFVSAVRAREPAGVDAVFDAIGGAHLGASRRALRRGGHLVAYGVSAAVTTGKRELLGTFGRMAAYRLIGPKTTFYAIGARGGADDATVHEDLARVLALRAEGKLAPIVAARVPFAEARRAHELLEAAAVAGKIVLDGPV